jgi:phosphatidyl-myo-inositol alpha-mannosyltransferase
LALRVGIVSEYYYPWLGGISENVHHTATELQARGHHVTLITPRLSVDLPPEVAAPNGISIVRVGKAVTFHANGSRTSAAIGGVRLWNELHTALRSQRFDILQLHSPLTPTLPALAALQGPWPRIGTFHSVFERSRWYEICKRPLQREFLGRMKGLTVVAPSVQLALSRYFDLDARVIPNGVDVQQFHPDVPRLDRFSSDKRTLLFLGRFEPRNGLSLMIRAFVLVRQQRDDVRLVIVGSGGDQNAYEQLVPPALRADVHFEGPALLERPSYYRTADVFCSPISRASFGLTLLEAMATGTPIVATDNIGYRALLEPAESVLVPYDEENFAAAVLDLLADEPRRREMSIAGRRKAERYAWPVVVSSLLDYFNEVLARS